MWFPAWLRNWKRWFPVQPMRGLRSSSGKPATFRPRLEALEDRTLLSSFSLSPPVSYPVGVGPSSLVVGDFNGDGKPDLAVANYQSNSVSVLLGNGDGTFQAARNSVVGAAPTSIAEGDFNGEGKLDLVVANFLDNSVSILLGNGDGTFHNAPNSPLSMYRPNLVAVGDFNGDGKLDVIVDGLAGGSM